MTDPDVQKLIDSEQKRAELDEHLALLAEISQKFATSLDITETLHTALGEIMNSLDAEAASIFLLENDDSVLVCRACAGPTEITGLTLPADKGIVGKAVRDNEVQMVRDVRKDSNFAVSVDQKTGFTTRSILCAPLSVKDKKLGAIELVNKKTASGLFDPDDQHVLMALAASAALAINNAAMATALIEEERIQHELALAREIQANLLPDRSVDDSPVNGVNIPIRELSGDFFDHFELPDGRIVFNLADVSGKGMNAAMLMAKTSSLFHCLGKTITEPDKLLAAVNNEVFENATRGMFVTMVGGIYDPAADTVVFANAGHQPPLVRKPDGSYQEYPAEAPPLGIMPDMAFPAETLKLDGASIYIYTDGLTEARKDGGQLGVSGIVGIINKFYNALPKQRLNHIIEEVNENGWELTDDLTVMIIEAKA